MKVSAVLRNCSMVRLKGSKFPHVYAVMRDRDAHKIMLQCLLENTENVPDKIYCTDKKSMKQINTCVRMGLAAATNEMQTKENEAFIDELGTCVSQHHKRRIRVERQSSRRRRQS
ncbi:uncharacterized protein LOC144100411 isoform X2 [Amblyomma americanum]